MDIDELMTLSAEKAVNEMEWSSIESLLQPTNQLELLARMDFDGTKKLINEWITTDAPDAMPHRFRVEFIPELIQIIELESFYRKLKLAHEQKEAILR